MKTSSFKPTASYIVSNEAVSSNKVIDSSDALSFKHIPATATSSKVDNTSRRKLLTSGAGLAVGAVLPAGIGALGMLSASDAEAGLFCPKDVPIPPGTVYMRGTQLVSYYDENNKPKPCWSAVSIAEQRVFGVQSTTYREKGANNLIFHAWAGDSNLIRLNTGKTITRYDRKTAAKVYNNGKIWWVEIFNYDKSDLPVMSFSKDLILNPITVGESFSIPDNHEFKKRSLIDRPNDQEDLTRQEARNRMDAHLRAVFVSWFDRLQNQNRWVNNHPWHRSEDSPQMTARPPFQPSRHDATSITIDWNRSVVAQTHGNETTPYFNVVIEMNRDPNHPNERYRGDRRTAYRMVLFRDYDFPQDMRYRVLILIDYGYRDSLSRIGDEYNFIGDLRNSDEIDEWSLIGELSESAEAVAALASFSDAETGGYINGFSLSNSNRRAVNADHRLLQAPLAAAFGAMGLVDGLPTTIPNNWLPVGVLQHILGFNSLLSIPERYRAIRDAFNRIVNNHNYPNIWYDLNDRNINHRRLVGYTHDLKGTLPPTTGECNGCPKEEGLGDDPSMLP